MRTRSSTGACLAEFGIRPLTAADAAAVARLVTADDAAYRQHFVPFEPVPEGIAAILAAAQRDCYWGIEYGGGLVGLIMLRGLDAGYAAPAFGVYIARRWSARRLGRLALAFAEAWCRLAGLDEIMLSVHPGNLHARREYDRAGFEPTGERTPRGHEIMRKRLVPR